MQHRSHSRTTSVAGTLALAVAALLAAACGESAGTTKRAGIAPFNGPQSNHVGCNAGVRFTGGGRVDPVHADVGKVTFGFNVDGRDLCDGSGTVRGQMQIVYHQTQTIAHTVDITHFSSFTDPEKGACGEFDGTVRVKHGGDWHEHHFFAEVCDKAEPGVGQDRLTFTQDGERGDHENVWDEVLRGGNIQAHK